MARFRGMENCCLTEEYPEAKNQLVTDNEKPRPVGIIKGRGQLGGDVPVSGNARLEEHCGALT
jgi:hypothetical protein